MSVEHPVRVIKVFVSYAHDPEIDGHRDRALKLAQALRRRGLDAMIDQYIEHDPPNSWPRWMLDQIAKSDFVLCLASPAYKARMESRGDPATGRGARWEGAIITEEMYENHNRSGKKFISIVLEGCSAKDIPDILFPIGRTYYILPQDSTILYHRLIRIPRATPYPLGPIIQPPAGGFSDHTAYFDVRDSYRAEPSDSSLPPGEQLSDGS